MIRKIKIIFSTCAFAFGFVVANAMLAFLGPSMFGAEIAWQAHIGGYITGAILFRYLLTRRPRAGI